MKEKEMAEGYQAMAEENKEFADMAADIAHEVIPEWEEEEEEGGGEKGVVW